MSTAIQEYSKTDAALAELAQRYKGVLFDVSTREGMQTAVKGRAEIRGYRVALEKTRKEIKAPALERCNLIDSEARRITRELESLELPIDEQIKAEETRKELERTAAARAEQARIEAEQAAIKKEEEDRMAAERAEIARKQAEIAAAEKAAREKIEAEERAARLRIEEQERAARMQREEADRKARQEREAEEARLKSERDKLEMERRAVEEAQRKERESAEAKARAEREAEEAKKREIERQANELKDGRELLNTFVTRFGKRKEFAPVAAAISAFLGGQ